MTIPNISIFPRLRGLSETQEDARYMPYRLGYAPSDEIIEHVEQVCGFSMDEKMRSYRVPSVDDNYAEDFIHQKFLSFPKSFESPRFGDYSDYTLEWLLSVEGDDHVYVIYPRVQFMYIDQMQHLRTELAEKPGDLPSLSDQFDNLRLTDMYNIGHGDLTKLLHLSGTVVQVAQTERDWCVAYPISDINGNGWRETHFLVQFGAMGDGPIYWAAAFRGRKYPLDPMWLHSQKKEAEPGTVVRWSTILRDVFAPNYRTSIVGYFPNQVSTDTASMVDLRIANVLAKLPGINIIGADDRNTVDISALPDILENNAALGDYVYGSTGFPCFAVRCADVDALERSTTYFTCDDMQGRSAPSFNYFLHRTHPSDFGKELAGKRAAPGDKYDAKRFIVDQFNQWTDDMRIDSTDDVRPISMGRNRSPEVFAVEDQKGTCIVAHFDAGEIVGKDGTSAVRHGMVAMAHGDDMMYVYYRAKSLPKYPARKTRQTGDPVIRTKRGFWSRLFNR